MSLLEAEIGNIASVLWFFAIEVDESRYVERVTFSGFLDGVQVSCWEIPLDERVAAVGLLEVDLPEPIKIEKATVSVKKKVKKAENDE
ncbi:peroxidase [Dickeya fangzhongdai]|nr:peroxidase [Dickeya fangzhongdai]